MGGSWLGLVQRDGRWVLPVTRAVLAGSGSLYGGCATAAVLEVASSLTPLAPRWATVHFLSAVPAGADVSFEPTLLKEGRTIVHARVSAAVGDAPVFDAHVALGDRPPLGEWRVPPPRVAKASDSTPFDLPAHAGTFAERLEWRLVPSASSLRPGTAAWWVRGEGFDAPAIAAGVLCDYATYGIGRATGHDIGGMSVDNTIRLYEQAPTPGWLLLEVTAEAIGGGFGTVTARVWRSDGALVATGAQTMVLNPWNWRQVGE